MNWRMWKIKFGCDHTPETYMDIITQYKFKLSRRIWDEDRKRRMYLDHHFPRIWSGSAVSSLDLARLEEQLLHKNAIITRVACEIPIVYYDPKHRVSLSPVVAIILRDRKETWNVARLVSMMVGHHELFSFRRRRRGADRRHLRSFTLPRSKPWGRTWMSYTIVATTDLMESIDASRSPVL